MFNHRSFPSLLLISALSSGACVAQADKGGTPTFKSSSRLVTLDVVVTAKNGAAVPKLPMDAFKVYENGAEQKLAFFEAPGSSQKATENLPDGVFSNKDKSVDQGALNIILIDSLNLDVTNQLAAKRELLKYLNGMKPSQSRTAVFLLNNKLSLLQPFTADLTLLKKATQSYVPQSSALSDRNVPHGELEPAIPTDVPEIADMITHVRQFENEQATSSMDRRVAITLDALRSVARSTSGYAGRKNLLWLTAGFPLSLLPDRARSSVATGIANPQTPAGRMAIQDATDSMTVLKGYDNELQQLSNALADAHIAVYPIDARFLVAVTDPAMSVAGIQNKAVVNKGTQYADELARGSFNLRNTQETMLAIAEETGGKAFTNRNDLINALVIGANESGSSYRIGYYPRSQKWDGKFKSIKVSLDQPGIELRYRPGYYALDQQKRKARDKEEEFKAAIWDPLPATELVFTAHPMKQSDSKLMMEFLVPADQLAFQAAAEDKKHIDMDFLVAAIGKDGKLLNLDSKGVSADLRPEVVAKIESGGLPFRMPVDRKPETVSYRLIVRDKTTSRTGRIDILLN